MTNTLTNNLTNTTANTAATATAIAPSGAPEFQDQQQPFRKTALGNGIRVVSAEMPHARSVSVSVFLGVGSRCETAEQAGLSHFLEHMVFKGTPSMPQPQQISAAIEGGGGSINAATEQELTVYWCKVAKPYFAQSLELLIDILRNSLYRADDIEKERLVIFEELAMINDHPGYKVDALIDEMLWPNHPLGRDIGGSRESVAGITRDMMLAYLDEHYTPANIVVGVAGAVAHEQAVAEVERLCEGWLPGERSRWQPYRGEQSEAQSRIEYRKTEQAHLSIALPGLSLAHPDRFALDMLSVMLGEGMSSRLFVEIRENRGLAYDVHSEVSHFSDTGALMISAGAHPRRIYDVVQTILEQVGQLREGVPEEELEQAKRLSAGRLLLRMDDTRAVANWLGHSELLLGELSSPDEVIGRINAVSTQDIRRVASALVDERKLNIAVVGPCRGRQRIRRMLKF